ncbi:hypothetical protein [Brevundimonas vesicularis]|uniref:hypothetical protein n=1 Tax=Brevundimonas vesicularis TaxID=41276 RepID=UPI00142F3A2C|nr:hypothetical protein [Brevundimonas vesicularis]
MSAPQTHIVDRVYQADSGKFCTLIGKPGVFRCDDDVAPSLSVIVQGNRAVRPS